MEDTSLVVVNEYDGRSVRVWFWCASHTVAGTQLLGGCRALWGVVAEFGGGERHLSQKNG